MPVRETAAIRIISTTAGVVTFWVLRKMLSLPASHIVRDDADAYTVYINLMALRQPYRSTQRPSRCSATRSTAYSLWQAGLVSSGMDGRAELGARTDHRVSALLFWRRMRVV